jgi:hypothetical protein
MLHQPRLLPVGQQPNGGGLQSPGNPELSEEPAPLIDWLLKLLERVEEEVDGVASGI